MKHRVLQTAPTIRELRQSYDRNEIQKKDDERRHRERALLFEHARLVRFWRHSKDHPGTVALKNSTKAE